MPPFLKQNEVQLKIGRLLASELRDANDEEEYYRMILDATYEDLAMQLKDIMEENASFFDSSSLPRSDADWDKERDEALIEFDYAAPFLNGTSSAPLPLSYSN